MLDINEIKKILPHRFPFLFVDKIIEIEENKKVVGIKNVTIDEPYFQGHFPDHPVMPGVLIIETMAQIGGILMRTVPDFENKLLYFLAIDNAKFRKPVFPGDQLKCELSLIKRSGKIWKMKGVAFVDNNVVAEAELMAAVVDKQQEKNKDIEG